MMDMKPIRRERKILEARPTQCEMLSARQYLQADRALKLNILDVKVVAPRLGEGGFGGLLVRYRNPVYKVG